MHSIIHTIPYSLELNWEWSGWRSWYYSWDSSCSKFY